MRPVYRPVETVRRRQQINDAIHLVLVGLVCLLAIFPFYWMVKSSLTTQSAFQWPPEMIPTSISVGPYVDVINGYPAYRLRAMQPMAGTAFGADTSCEPPSSGNENVRVDA